MHYFCALYRLPCPTSLDFMPEVLEKAASALYFRQPEARKLAFFTPFSAFHSRNAKD